MSWLWRSPEARERSRQHNGNNNYYYYGDGRQVGDGIQDVRRRAKGTQDEEPAVEEREDEQVEDKSHTNTRRHQSPDRSNCSSVDDADTENVDFEPGRRSQQKKSSGSSDQTSVAQGQSFHSNRLARKATSLPNWSEPSDISRDALVHTGRKEANIAGEQGDEGSEDKLWFGGTVQTLRAATVLTRRLLVRISWVLAVLLAVLLAIYGIFSAPLASSPHSNRPSLDPSLPVFAILGQTGVGKSTLIKTLGGRNLNTTRAPEICAGLESCTEEIAFYKADLYFGGVYLIDTPGFDDSKGRDDDAILEMIFRELEILDRSDKLLKGVIYLYDISATRIGRMTQERLANIRHLCGSHDLSHLMLVMTRWSSSTSPEFERQADREQELKLSYWAEAIKLGSDVQRYYNDKDSASAFLAILKGRKRQFAPPSVSLPQRPRRQEAQESQVPTGEHFSDTDSLSLSSVWSLHSATVICSAPWWTALVIVLRLLFMCAIDFCLLDEVIAVLRLVFRGTGGKYFARKWSALLLIVSAYALDGRSMARFEPLDDAERVACTLTVFSIYQLPTLLFRFALLLLPCLVAYNGADNVEVAEIVLPCLIVWLLQYIFMW